MEYTIVKILNDKYLVIGKSKILGENEKIKTYTHSIESISRFIQGDEQKIAWTLSELIKSTDGTVSKVSI